MVGEGRFLRELHHLLNGISSNMPSLNQRREDIPALAAIYINQYNAEFSRVVTGLEPDTIAALQVFRWVLNIDQLRTVIRQLVLTAAPITLPGARWKRCCGMRRASRANRCVWI